MDSNDAFTIHSKLAVVRTVGRTRIRKRFFTKLLKLFFLWHVWPPIEVVTGHCKNAMTRAGGHLGGTL